MADEWERGRIWFAREGRASVWVQTDGRVELVTPRQCGAGGVQFFGLRVGAWVRRRVSDGAIARTSAEEARG